MIDLNELKKKAHEYSNAYSECRFEEDTIHFEAELADIICCVLIIAENERIDIEQALLDCIEKNRKRAEGTGDKK